MNAHRTPRPDQRPRFADEWQRADPAQPQGRPIIDAPCATPAVAAPMPATQRGFTLIEMLMAVGVAGVLSTVALPSFEAQLQKGRRADALVSMIQVQAAQERFRGNGISYGSLASIGVPARSGGGHYALDVLSFDDSGYEALATATGAQARDTACRFMRVTSVGANTTYASGPTPAATNPADANRACWNL